MTMSIRVFSQGQFFSQNPELYKMIQKNLSPKSHEMYDYQLPRSLTAYESKQNKSYTQVLQNQAQKIYQNIISIHKKQHESDWTIHRHFPLTPILSMAVSPCGIIVVFGSKKIIKILNIPQNSLENYLKTSSNIASLYFSPNGEYLLCGSPEFLEILNFQQKTLNSRIPISSERSINAIFTADGEFVAYPENNSIVFWSFLTKSEEFRLNGHERAVMSLACSADGRFIISGSLDRSIILWNFESRRQEFRFIDKQPITTVKIQITGCMLQVFLDQL